MRSYKTHKISFKGPSFLDRWCRATFTRSMRFTLFFISLLIFKSCSTIDAEFPVKSLISPEAAGEMLKGSASISFYNLHTATVPSESRLSSNDRALSFEGDTFEFDVGASIEGEVGLLRNIDLLLDLTGQIGLKYQLMGDPKNSAKAGNKSLSFAVTYFTDSESDLDDGGFSSSYTANLDLETTSLYLIYGYRTTDTVLAFVNLRYREDSFTASIKSGALAGNDYDYESSQLGLGAGVMAYSNDTEFGFEVNYQPFKWTFSERENELSFALRGGILFL